MENVQFETAYRTRKAVSKSDVIAHPAIKELEARSEADER